MLTVPEIVNSVRGTLRLLRFDPAGVAYFDNTTEALWRSFRVMVVAAPVYAAIRYLSYEEYTVEASEFEVALVETLYYVIQWFLYPVIAWEIARFADLRRNYPRYIASVNWINLMLLSFGLGVSLMREIAPLMNVGFAIGFWLLLAIWFMAAARLMLGASWGLVLGLFAVDIFVSELMSGVVHNALGLVRL